MLRRCMGFEALWVSGVQGFGMLRFRGVSGIASCTMCGLEV